MTDDTSRAGSGRAAPSNLALALAIATAPATAVPRTPNVNCKRRRLDRLDRLDRR